MYFSMNESADVKFYPTILGPSRDFHSATEYRYVFPFLPKEYKKTTLHHLLTTSSLFSDFLKSVPPSKASDFSSIKSRTCYFIKTMMELLHINDADFMLRRLTLEHVRLFEKLVMNQVVNELVKPATAHKKMKVTKQFLDYLNLHNVIRFRYKVPEAFIAKASRTNCFVDHHSLVAFLECIYSKQHYPTFKRNRAIILLLIETGARPIELCNIRVEDVSFSGNTLSLTSIKSKRRTLKIDPFVMECIKSYYKEKHSFSESPYLFVDVSDRQLNTIAIGSIMHRYNMLAFGKVRFSAKALRHTFCTNALNTNNANSFGDVVDAMGHVQYKSTLYYMFRSKQRLLDETLPFNPVKGVLPYGPTI